jgi:hypothetical protein
MTGDHLLPKPCRAPPLFNLAGLTLYPGRDFIIAAIVGRCEVPGCPKLSEHKHHIYTRGRYCQAAMVVANEFYCCADHHILSGDSWHQKGRERFAKAHGLGDRVEKARQAVQGKMNERYRRVEVA